MANRHRFDKWSWRVYPVFLLLGLCVLLMAGRLVQLQLANHERGVDFLKRQGDARVLRVEQLPASRGVIVDRNGELLAFSTPMKSLWAEPKVAQQGDSKLQQLAEDLDVPYALVKKRIHSDSNFVYLRRLMAPHEADSILERGYPGVHSQVEYQRFYPAGEVASHLVGFTNIDNQGQEGMELSYNALLSAEWGAKQVMKDRRGNKIKDIKLLRPASAGQALALSIDMNLQYAAYRELKAAVSHYRARSGSLVLLDVQTGEVLALVNQPSYNANDRSQLVPADMRNRALIDVFEPGSTVKPFTIAAALESGRYSPSSTIDTSPGYFRVGKKVFSDPRDYGVLDLTRVLSKSSQVGTTKLALDVDIHDIHQLFADVGLGQYCATGFPGEQPGYLPSHRTWSSVDRATLAFGHGLSVNALQLARAYAVIASDGIKRPVTLLKQEEAGQGNTQMPAADGERVMSSEVARTVREMMVAVTEKGGTGLEARVPGYSVAGKTGTAHKVGGSGYEKSRYRSTFAGMVPANNPRLVAVVTIDEPGGEKYFGGEIAAPVFSRVMQAALRTMNITPDQLQELSTDVVLAPEETATDGSV